MPKATSRLAVAGPRHAAPLSRGARVRRRVAAGAAALSLVAGVAVTLALWNVGATTAGPVITVGHLTAKADGFSWQETSADVPQDKRAKGTDAGSLMFFQAMPGDSIEILQKVSVDASGRNLDFQLKVDWAKQTADVVTKQLTATYVVRDNKTGVALPAGDGTPVGTALTLPTTMGEGKYEFTVVIRLEYKPAEPKFGSPSNSYRDPVQLPSFTVAAEQVRGQS